MIDVLHLMWTEITKPELLPTLKFSIGFGLFMGTVVAIIAIFDIRRSERLAAAKRKKLNDDRKAEHE